MAVVFKQVRAKVAERLSEITKRVKLPTIDDTINLLLYIHSQIEHECKFELIDDKWKPIRLREETLERLEKIWKDDDMPVDISSVLWHLITCYSDQNS